MKIFYLIFGLITPLFYDPLFAQELDQNDFSPLLQAVIKIQKEHGNYTQLGRT